MITISDELSRSRRTREAWALLASALLNFLLLPLLVWLFGSKMVFVPNQQREQFVVSSSAVHIEHRTVPQPASAPHRALPLPQHAQVPKTTVHHPPSQHHELAREEPQAAPQPPARTQATLAQTLAKDEQAFSQETKTLHAENNPMSVATIAPQPPSTYQRSYVDINGKDKQENVFAVLTVREKFQTAALHCYYVRYDAQFSGGGTDDGTIPWPVCYPKDHDAMLPLDRPHMLPVPAPQPGYVLPPGTVLSPLLQEIYDRKIQN